jgi:hypothetical protein
MQPMGSHQEKNNGPYPYPFGGFIHTTCGLRKMMSLIAPRSLADASKSQQITHKILESKRADLKPQPCHVVAMCLPF